MASDVPETDTDPLSAPHLPASEPDEGSSRLVGKTAVIVEEDAFTQLHLRSILRRAGVHVAASTQNGAEGIAAVLREQPDLVLMSTHLRGDFNGLEAARRILNVLNVCV